MWCGTLRGNDIQRASAELKVQRAAIQAHYDNEMKRLETKIAELETFECAVVNFVSNYDVEDGSSATVPGPAAEAVADEIASEEGSSASLETSVERPKITRDYALDKVDQVHNAEITLLNSKDSSRAAGVAGEVVERARGDRVWTPTERALLALKQSR